MLASDDPSSTYLFIVEIPAPHLVIQQVSGQPGQMGHLIDRVSQPFGMETWPFLASLDSR
jgi:hypothetical protein